MNVLLLTNIYPNNDPEYGGTAVCHSFTTEWNKMGYNVQVVHFDSLFPRPYYWVGKLFNKFIQAKTGTVAYTKTPRRPLRYTVDGIPVLFVPMKKYVPHKAPSQRITEAAFHYIIEELAQDGFTPDVVTAHFVLPQLQFMPLFKKQFPQARTCLVLHGESTLLLKFYPNEFKKMMSAVDIWGFRSLAFQQNFEDRFGSDKPMFLCHSGIPEKYLEAAHRDFSDGVKRFSFVGSLYELKNVDITLRALNEALRGRDYHFDIVGSGAEFNSLNDLVDELGMRDHVTFHGQKSRDEAQDIIRKADCFVMVSTREAFGLVYVEAMAKGSIVIGTVGQGIDGIIRHGENGFLCRSRDVNGLAQLIREIVCLPKEKLLEISTKAVLTAENLTDRKVAEHYLKAVIG